MSAFTGATVLLPAVNETLQFEQTARGVLSACANADIDEILIILCQKTTPECRATAEKIRSMANKVRVTIYDQQRPFVGMAMREGFQMARGSHVIMMSTDMETPPEVCGDFIALAKANPDAIITASRWITGGSFEGYNYIKLVCNFLFQHMLAALFMTKLTDLTYGYRIFPVSLVRRIKWEEEKHPFFLETALKPLRLGVPFLETPARWQSRSQGESQNSFFQNFKYVKTALRARFMRRRDMLL